MAQLVNNLPAIVGDLGSISGLGRSPRKGKGYPLQHSGLENSMDCIVHRVAKSQTWLSDLHTHSYILPHNHDWQHSIPKGSLSECMLSHFSRVWLFATPCNPCGPPGTSVHGILQARILEWVAVSSSRGSSQPRNRILGLLHLLHWQVSSLPLAPTVKLKVSLDNTYNT